MSAAAREVELKFLCAPEDLDRVLAAAPPGQDETRHLISTYFDTAKGDLRKAGVSLRVRENGGKRVQTLKRGEGLSREEHEAPLSNGALDLSIGPLRELLDDKGRRRLAPAFQVDVTRRQRLVCGDGAEIELAADLGEVREGDVAAPVCEVELELKSGPPEALFRLARRLSTAAPLYLSFEGKAAQGQTLLQGGRLSARRWEAPRLEPEATAAEAFQALGRSCIGQIAANAAVLRRADEAEAVHQLRVAVRRLRGALSMFAPILGDDAAGARLGDELKWLANACDNARNLDVYLAETVRPAAGATTSSHGIDALVQCLEAARAGARNEVLAAVSSSRFRELLVEVVAWMETGAWLAAPDAGRAARGFVAGALDRLRRKLFKSGFDLAALDDPGRHKVRIQAKRLRYAADGCASLFDAEAVKRFVDRLKAVQDQLGTLNDIATAEGLVGRLAPDPAAAYAAGHLAGLRAARRPKLIRRGGRALRRLAKVEPFWRA